MMQRTSTAISVTTVLLLWLAPISALAFQAAAPCAYGAHSRLNVRSTRVLLNAQNNNNDILAEEDVTVTKTSLSSPEQQQQEQLPEMALEFIDDSDSGDNDNPNAFSYATFAQEYPFANNIMIATAKTALADLLAQTVIAQTPLDSVDWQRSLLFCLFGATYLGGFQYLYQVQIFKKLFNVDQFTSQTWSEKAQDKEGLKALAAQTALDLGVLTAIYLPTFYVFKASVFSGSLDPSVWLTTGLDNYQTNFSKDEFDLIRVWLPADLVCFSVPLYLRLPVRHVVSFVWTAYLSFARGGH